jgi:asparagine synthase (glutamine-hydrolysing)
MLVDTVTYLPDDLLVKVDRAAMSVSLEVRVPFLSPEVFDFAWGLQAGDRIRGSEGKWVVKRLLGRSLPDDLISRPKMGFGIPVGDWLRGPLRDWADDLLSADTVRRQGLFNVDEVVRRWSAHREGSSDLTFQVWALLMFQSWLARTESER